MKGFSLEAARAHAARHNYDPQEKALGRTAETPVEATTSPTVRQVTLPKPVKMTRPEKEYGLRLEAMKRRRDIFDYRFHGMTLTYAPDPETGILLRYTCDYVVIERTLKGELGEKPLSGPWSCIKIVEVKGSGKYAISTEAKLRFKGARSAWPIFQFEMWQLAGGEWHRVL